ncbi:hypothetical protein HZZ02_08395 [Streptococcus danieliae]|nr:hypothetical protein [Streptococcus danieliae]
MKLVNVDRGWINPYVVSAILPLSKSDYQTSIYLIGDDKSIYSKLSLDEVVAIINGGLE